MFTEIEKAIEFFPEFTSSELMKSDPRFPHVEGVLMVHPKKDLKSWIIAFGECPEHIMCYHVFLAPMMAHVSEINLNILGRTVPEICRKISAPYNYFSVDQGNPSRIHRLLSNISLALE